MRILVIGATGHIGSSLVPKLVENGFEAIGISRGNQMPYHLQMKEFREVESKKGIDIIPPESTERNWTNANLDTWENVRLLSADRLLLEKEGTFGMFVNELKPDVVCDLTCYTLDQLEQVTKEISYHVHHYICMGSIWIYDYNITSPADESHPRNGMSAYGRGKIEIEEKLMELSNTHVLPSTIIHAGHIVGSGWIPLNPQGNFNRKVFEDISAGNEIILPDFGLYTLHHVHAEDVSDLIISCVKNPQNSISQSFHAVSPAALTLRGFSESMYQKFHKEPKIKYLPMNDFLRKLSLADAFQSYEHCSRSPSASMEKAKQRLGFVPKYSSIQAVSESIDFLAKMGGIKIV